MNVGTFAVVGHEEEIVCSPGGALGSFGCSPLLYDHLAQDATQGDDRETLRLELDEEDAPRLVS